MASPSGLNAQLGFAAETTFGTAVTPTRFVPFTSESIEATPDFLESAGIIAGQQILNSNQWTHGVWRIGGDIAMEMLTRQCGLLLHHALGSITTSSSAGTSTHTITPGDLGGLGLTVQKGVPDGSGTVQPFTYAGVKIASAEIAVAATENATFGLSVVAQTFTTGTALATATYLTTGSPFSFASGSFSLAGSSLCVRSARLSIDNMLDTDRVCVGHTYIEEPVPSEYREFGGEMELEFPDLVHYNRFVAGTEGTMNLLLTNGTASIRAVSNVRTDAFPVSVNDRGLVVANATFKCTASVVGNNASALTITYVTADTTP